MWSEGSGVRWVVRWSEGSGVREVGDVPFMPIAVPIHC